MSYQNLYCFWQNAGEASVANIDRLRHANGSTPTADIRLKMQKAMQNHAAVFRSSDSLTEGCDKLDECFKIMDQDIKVKHINLFTPWPSL